MSTISKTLGQRNVKIDVANVKNDIDSCSSVTSSLKAFYIGDYKVQHPKFCAKLNNLNILLG